ncbi:PREDICTED: protein TonB-like isoform X2 [Pseudopodoces humilis]|uniref:protein TonB-like isoform X2 n=1 Tax=Pseudopodoces humilis TaxID=181119 RepID=UPI0006B80F3C|nr:PREDICTED: protein TonB-like isoform X2 [Pseudopodoces humilis]
MPACVGDPGSWVTQKDQAHRGPNTALAPAQQAMAVFPVAIAFLVGLAIGAVIVALAKGETIDFSRNFKYFGFSFSIGDSAKISKRKPMPDEGPKKETISDEESRKETAPGDNPKKETTSDEDSGETNTGDEAKKETTSDEDSGETNTGDEAKKETTSDEDSGETNTGDEPKKEDSPGNKGKAVGAAIGATVGAGVALVGLPLCIGALGFTGAGIAAGSIAAKMMSAAAIANGGGVAAGSTVAVLQSIGAAGFSLGAKVGLTSALSSVGAASGAWLSKWKNPPSYKPKKG